VPAKEAWQFKKADSGQVYKDLPLATLQQWILEARIDAQDPVKGPGMADWAQAGAVPELLRYFSPQRVGSDLISSADVGNPFGSRDEEELVMDLTPFIDITFLLLIFFVVTAQFQQQSMRVNPPEAKHTASRRQEKLIVVITKEGEVHLGTQLVAVKDLAKVLRAEMDRTLQQNVVIRGDRKSNLGLFVKVLDQCKEAKAKKIFVGAVKQK